MTWNEYIEVVLPVQQREILRLFSRAVLENRKPEKMLCLYGPGRNGKSTILGALRAASFDIARKPSVVLHPHKGKFFDVPSTMGRIVGTPMVTIVDLVSADSFIAFLKALHSGEKLEARAPYSPEAVHWVSFDGGIAIDVNRMPEVFLDGAMLARMDILYPVHVIDFRNRDFLGKPTFVDQFREWALEED